MKLSQFISELNKIKSQHGDIDITVEGLADEPELYITSEYDEDFCDSPSTSDLISEGYSMSDIRKIKQKHCIITY